MPLTDKGQEIMAAMKKQYGDKKGEQVFYASKNAGRISGVDDDGEVEREMERVTRGVHDAMDRAHKLSERLDGAVIGATLEDKDGVTPAKVKDPTERSDDKRPDCDDR